MGPLCHSPHLGVRKSPLIIFKVLRQGFFQLLTIALIIDDAVNHPGFHLGLKCLSPLPSPNCWVLLSAEFLFGNSLWLKRATCLVHHTWLPQWKPQPLTSWCRSIKAQPPCFKAGQLKGPFELQSAPPGLSWGHGCEDIAVNFSLYSTVYSDFSSLSQEHSCSHEVWYQEKARCKMESPTSLPAIRTPSLGGGKGQTASGVL